MAKLPTHAPTVWDIRRAGLAQFEMLMSKPNVRYMTVGYKVSDGIRQSQKALKIYVTRKHDVARSQVVPENVRASSVGALGQFIPTDVIELGGVPRAFGLRSGHIIRAFNGDRGVCAISYSRDGAKFLLTNAHVVVDVANGGVSGPVAVLNRVDGKYYQLGNVLNASRLDPNQVTTHDVARIAVHPDIQVDDFMILDMDNDVGSIGGIETLATHEYWYRVEGRRFGCMFPERVVGPAPIEVDGIEVPYAEFWQLQMVSGVARPGHSGALLCRMNGSDVIACGLVFGGEEQNLVFAFPFNKMWKLVNPG